MTAKAERNALIAQFRRAGSTLQQLAFRFGISSQAVSKILQARPPARGRPCPQCAGNSRTIRTYPPEPHRTRRVHRCLECAHQWTTIQTDNPT